MHRKSIEAAEQLKDSETTSDHEDTTSMRTDTSDTSSQNNQSTNSSSHTPNPNPMIDSKEQLNIAGVVQTQPPPPVPNPYPDDPEVFRNNSIACLRAKAQEHSAKLMNHNFMVHSGGSRSGSEGCDANQNTLHHPDGAGAEQGIFWHDEG